MKDNPAPNTFNFSVDVTFSQVPDGWVLTDIELSPPVTGIAIGALASALSQLADKYGDGVIRSGFYSPGAR